nr:Chain D, Contactin-associated protein-like 4 peptide [Homo sapiens]4NXQ_E Chain E, Contactin-associated protein-like 4 peptide [Homo sapiens]4NXQ_F Chain F, Contactin-associated protein-like 4 peptide [Homo sapiens]
ENQKEYFF